MKIHTCNNDYLLTVHWASWHTAVWSLTQALPGSGKPTKTSTGTGTKFGGYLSSSPMLNDNISLEKLSNFTLNANYIQ